MALAKDIPITRLDVEKWILAWRRLPKRKRKGVTLEDYIRARVDRLELDDPLVDTSGEGRDNLPDRTHVADLIIADLPSYANTDS